MTKKHNRLVNPNCDECKGSGWYTGLNDREPCRICLEIVNKPTLYAKGLPDPQTPLVTKDEWSALLRSWAR